MQIESGENIFLAPTGAQEMLIFVCAVQTCPEQTIFINQRPIKEQSESNQNIEISHTVGA